VTEQKSGELELKRIGIGMAGLGGAKEEAEMASLLRGEVAEQTTDRRVLTSGSEDLIHGPRHVLGRRAHSQCGAVGQSGPSKDKERHRRYSPVGTSGPPPLKAVRIQAVRPGEKRQSPAVLRLLGQPRLEELPDRRLLG
jgi:hypothetical protein